MIIAALVLILVSSFLWRIRGGLINALTGQDNFKLGPIVFNDTVVRLIWAIGLTLTYGLFAGFSWKLIILAILLFLGATIGWFGAELFPKTIKDVILITVSGLARMALVSLALLSLWPLLAGLLCGLAYYVGSKIPQKPGGWDFWQEWIFGALIGLSLFLTLI